LGILKAIRYRIPIKKIPDAIPNILDRISFGSKVLPGMIRWSNSFIMANTINVSSTRQNLAIIDLKE